MTSKAKAICEFGIMDMTDTTAAKVVSDHLKVSLETANRILLAGIPITISGYITPLKGFIYYDSKGNCFESDGVTKLPTDSFTVVFKE